MKKKYVSLMMAMFFASLIFSLTACGDDDKPQEQPNTPTILGVWEFDGGDAWDYIKFGYNHIWEFSEMRNIEQGYYYFDEDHNLLILHYERNNSDVDIYEVTRLTDSRLTYIWIDDVSDMYTTSIFDIKLDKEICNRVYSEGYAIDHYGETPEHYKRSNSDIFD